MTRAVDVPFAKNSADHRRALQPAFERCATPLTMGTAIFFLALNTILILNLKYFDPLFGLYFDPNPKVFRSNFDLILILTTVFGAKRKFLGVSG